MKLDALGYSPLDGHHTKLLTRMEGVFVGILWVDHVGQNKAISANALACQFAWGVGRVSWVACSRNSREHWKRDVRRMQNHLLRKHDDIPVLSKAGPTGGYWIAGSDAEAGEFYSAFRRRGLTGLVKATDGKTAALVEAVEQLAFEFDDLADETSPVTTELKQTTHMAPEIVDALLAKMTREPDIFAANLRNIREKYFAGGVLLEKDRISEMQQKAGELQDMMRSLGN